MLVDFIILLFAFSSLYRGREIGFIRQLSSAAGFFGGLFLGAWLQQYTRLLAQTDGGQSLLTVMTTLGSALVFLTIGEFIGIYLKHHIRVQKRVNKHDIGAGGLIGVVSLFISAWLLAALASALPFIKVQEGIQKSRIVSALNDYLPDAPTVLANFGQLIDPNGFPDVFTGAGPIPRTDVATPSLGSLQQAVSLAQDSVVKLESRGCGGLVDGSGFVVGNGLVVTNAHVVAGIRNPTIKDQNGSHQAQVIAFDPSLDFALLRADDLSGAPLRLDTTTARRGTPAAVLGYPGGGGLKASAAVILDQFIATGRNIYGRGISERSVYEIKANVIPGNSGGPLVAADGKVIGVIFAESTSYDQVGYALTAAEVAPKIAQAMSQNRTVSTGSCTAS